MKRSQSRASVRSTAFRALGLAALLLSCLALPWVVQAQGSVMADRDGDGLIEIDNLTMLHNMRYDLAGGSYKTSTASVGDSSGCPALRCIGYELAQPLDFDTDDDGTWSGDSSQGYSLDENDSMAPYFVVDSAAGGWQPIGDRANPFAAVFDGNGHSIGNLAIRRDQSHIGLFGAMGEGAAIRNLGLVANLADYTGSSDGEISIGGLVGRQNNGSITASYATGAADGGAGDFDQVGGLVGLQDGGSIILSYARGAADGGGGDSDRVGGLVGRQDGGSIILSYARGDADGGIGDDDRVGGLVGYQFNGSITASYARGDADGGIGDDDRVGGLVGRQDGGSITASYARGDADGGSGNEDNAGRLVGNQQNGSIWQSYGFGGLMGGDFTGPDGTPPVSSAAELTATHAGSSWNAADSNTLGAWDFGDSTQVPALNYADYDGQGMTFSCGQFLPGVCDPATLLPGQDDVSAGDSSLVPFGAAATLTGSIRFGRVAISSWHWRQLRGPTVTLRGADRREATFLVPNIMATLVFGLTAIDGEGQEYSDRVTLLTVADIVDEDGDGLIEIHDLAMLHNMRYDLAGLSYKTSTASVGDSSGCPALGCIGYELVQPLDFDTDDDGTWSGDSSQGYSLDENDSMAPYFVVDSAAGGWQPIGDRANPFAAVFDGNGHSIGNLAIRRDQASVGLFGVIGEGAAIRNLGLVDNLADYTGSSDDVIFIGGLVGRQYDSSIILSYATGNAAGGGGDYDGVGGLVGYQFNGSITASYATGAADGGDGDNDQVGGLVGRQEGGSIILSYATGNAAGGGGDYDGVGGLVGYQFNGSITASYATGAADGGVGEADYVGGLVGYPFNGSITASYATGAADGGDGDNDQVGGLVGYQDFGSITASYATGAADGGDGENDWVGGLVAFQLDGSITASYATGAADGGDGDNDQVGGLVGNGSYSSITASYATGAADGGDGDNDWVGGLVGRLSADLTLQQSYGFGGLMGGESAGADGAPPVSSAADLTATHAGSSWNAADNNTLGAWNFGDSTQVPALNYADYDGQGITFSCGQFPPGVCDPATLLPGQGDLSAGDSSTVLFGAAATLTGSLRFGRVSIMSWHWRQLQGAPVTLRGADSREATFLAPESPATLVFRLTAIDDEGQEYSDRVTLLIVDDIVDEDGDGLIEIHDLAMLHNMRYDLAGRSYKTSTASVGDSSGCPALRCIGYELVQPLDFDTDADGTWSGNSSEGYSLDGDDSMAPYFEVDSAAGGWQPIGDEAKPFAAVFDGNGHSIGNLAIRRDQASVGLFGVIREGAAIRNLGLFDNLADYTGFSEAEIYIGGLVGWQRGGAISTSYATGAADGGGGSHDRVGGLVGRQDGGSITASYATGAADGGVGNTDYVGGLVGRQDGGSITASYATGAADGGVGNTDYVGGLVGRQDGGSITASYATGAADGGVGNTDYVGRLVGQQTVGSTTQQSYGFGGLMGGESAGADGAPPVSSAAELTATHVASSWNAADSNTLGAWDFGDSTQVPALNYADYDGRGMTFSCGQFPPGVCDPATLLPGQGDLSAGDSSAVLFGAAVTLTGSLAFGRVAIMSWHWRQLQGAPVTLRGADSRELTFLAPEIQATLVFRLTVIDGEGQEYSARVTLLTVDELVDEDGDGLIEIHDLAMLHNMRYDLAGRSYKTSTASVGDSSGCPALRCIGYELVQPLDFDIDADGTWSGGSSEGYSLDGDDSMAPYFVVDSAAGGWQPIGDEAKPFAAVFDGNGHSIGNLAIRRDQASVGLFGVIREGAAIRNLGLFDNLADYTGFSEAEIYIGGLVGWQRGGAISTSYATGAADGGGGSHDRVGGLVGRQDGGSITASYATGDADGGVGNTDYVGGLVGRQDGGSITASYATGDADGGVGNTDYVGGLVGRQDGGSITASYATGDADGGVGNTDYVGRLVGQQTVGSTTQQSYGFGGLMGGESAGADGAPPVSSAADLTATHAGSSWNAADNNTLGAWDFGDSTQVPALNYADYDAEGMTFSCGQFPPGVCDSATLLPGQHDQVDLSAGDSSAVQFGAAATLTGSVAFGRVAIRSWHWQQLQGPTVTLRGAASREATFLAPAIPATLVFMLTAIDGEGQQYSDRVTLLIVDELVDEDGNGLIEIDDLAMLHNMRYDLAGRSYRTSTASVGDSSGCPALRCIGYELVQHLDFDTDDNGTWSGNSSEGYSLDGDDSRAPYFVVDSAAGGWRPIGDGAHPFVAVFDGNGHSIGNLAIRRDQASVGLFGVIGEGAAIRNLGLVDNLADYTGSSDDKIFIGGLVGIQKAGTIGASYARGSADGGDGMLDRVGGLVGYQERGSITASYARGSADGGSGAGDRVGGLVGYQERGSITASYARGSADGGDGREDWVGGLVGYQGRGSITASYATGSADGGDGMLDRVGGLVGHQDLGSITASYGFGVVAGEKAGSDGSMKPQGVSAAAQLTMANAGASWDAAVSNTLGVWDFGTDEQVPALNYADYDGLGTVFNCDQFPTGVCDPATLLPGQAEMSAGDSSAVLFGAAATLTGSVAFGRVAIRSWHWQQLQGPTVTLRGAASREATFLAPENQATLVFRLTAIDDEGQQYSDRVTLLTVADLVDEDGDGLIEIHDLAMLHNMRYDLVGRSYKTSPIASVGDSSGCPALRCIGYELVQPLDFDTDADGTWSGDSSEGYSLDENDSMAPYFVVDSAAGGWQPIGDEAEPFAAVFDGNGHSIGNLAIRRDQAFVGLFGVIEEGAAIRNLGLVDNLADYTGSSGGEIFIGGLVGWQKRGAISASYASGTANGGSGPRDQVGGLVGLQDGGSITASYATGAADGGGGRYDRVGGLVGGMQNGGSIILSYATGAADGGGGDFDRVGGLVGWQDGGSIILSYATGSADGGLGNDDRVGGLVGRQFDGSITASYATGNVDGGGGDYDRVGGLVGRQSKGSITASYARGDVNGGIGDGDRVGRLIGFQGDDSMIWQSYGFGGLMGGDFTGPDGAPPVPSAAELTATHAGSSWNAAASNTLGAWDFGDSTQVPALNYADYDGQGMTFSCGQFPPGVCDPATLLPGQADVSAGDSSLVPFGAAATLTGSLRFGRVAISSWHWRQLRGPTVTLRGADRREATFLVPNIMATLVFRLTAIDDEGQEYSDRVTLLTVADIVDEDGDGLIEIHDLAMLHNMRYDLAGGSYKTSTASVGNSSGCPALRCIGYELVQPLDFDTDDDGTWSGGSSEGYSLDENDSMAPYFVVDSAAGGWQPIGDRANPFVAVFDGNGHSIGNLAIRRSQTAYVGFFGAIGGSAVIRNLGLVDNLADYTGSSDSKNYIGGLVGLQRGGAISTSYATGNVDGGGGRYDEVGGLVGRQLDGSIAASYATGAADGGGGDYSRVGGLVGRQAGGSIILSYATGNADGGGGYLDRVGGLVGLQEGGGSIILSYATGNADGGGKEGDQVGGLVGYQDFGSITASYATGDAAGGSGNVDRVGGLVGYQENGSITASYATGTADGGSGIEDQVGGLVGLQFDGSITASYATGNVDGGGGHADIVGGLVGRSRGSITASYATGAADGGVGNTDYVGRLIGFQGDDSMIWQSYGFGGLMGGDSTGPDGAPPVPSAAELTATHAGSSWNAAASNTLGAWDFGSDEQIPVLNYADYDGEGAAFNCDQFPPGACGTFLPGQVPPAALKALQLSAGVVLHPAFTRATLTYTASVVNDIEFITIATMPAHLNALAEITPADADGTGDGHQVNLAVGENLIAIEVTAADGMNVQRYTLTLTRAPSADATLGALELSGGVALRPIFAAAVRSYTASVANDIETITLTAVLTHARASVAITPADADLTAEGYQLALNMGPNLIAMEVTAEDGMNVQRYTLTLTRAPSADATLGALELSGGVALRPIFAAAVRSYTASVANDIETITLTAVPTHANAWAGITPADADLNAEGYQLALNVGPNLIAMEVTAEDGMNVQRYTLTLTRAPSADATLGVLELSGGVALRPIFAAAVRSYTASVANDIETITLTATPTHANAWAGITPADADLTVEGYQLALDVGPNLIAMEVTAEDGMNVQTYTLTLTRAPPSIDATLDALELSGGVALRPIFAAAVRSYTASVANDIETITLTAAPTHARASVAITPADADLTAEGYQLALNVGSNLITITIEVTAADGDTTQQYTLLTLTLIRRAAADRDGNGLIEIDNPTMLHNMRYNLAGTSYKTTDTNSAGDSSGCPASGCFGYELEQDLDFDTDDDDDATWSGNSSEGYSLDRDDSMAPYFKVDSDSAGGWQPIGDNNNPFDTVFDGNSHTISNLAIRRAQATIGLFGAIGEGAAIRNLGLVNNLADYTGSDNGGIRIGGLVGLQDGGMITTSYTTGNADGGNGDAAQVGGLVGAQFSGSITASYAKGDVAGGGNPGGSASVQQGRSISGGYIAGAAAGGDNLGGLVGFQEGGSIRTSYAEGEVAGGDGDDVVGGLVGVQSGTIRASYAEGDASGGAGDDVVGALVGEMTGGHGTGSIIASYATGDADGGGGDNDVVGTLVGKRVGAGRITESITASYSFGQGINGNGEGSPGSAGTPWPEGVDQATDLSAENAGPSWLNGDWDFGTGDQPPAVQYNNRLIPGQRSEEGGGGGGDSGGDGSGGNGSGGGSLSPWALALLLPSLFGWRRGCLFARPAAPLEMAFLVPGLPAGLKPQVFCFFIQKIHPNSKTRWYTSL